MQGGLNIRIVERGLLFDVCNGLRWHESLEQVFHTIIYLVRQFLLQRGLKIISVLW